MGLCIIWELAVQSTSGYTGGPKKNYDYRCVAFKMCSNTLYLVYPLVCDTVLISLSKGIQT